MPSHHHHHHHHHHHVSGEWVRDKFQRDRLIRAFNKKIDAQLDRLQELGMPAGRRMDIAIDMHLIKRWDKNHGADLIRSKRKGRTSSFERYITGQCINQRGSPYPRRVSHARP